MKKMFFVLILNLFAVPGAFSQSMLKVSLTDRSPIMISVDGRHFQKHGESITVGDMPPGRHYLKIFTFTVNRRGWEQNDLLFEGRVTTNNGMVTNFVLDPENGNADVQQHEMNEYNNGPEPNENHRPNYNENNYQNDNHNENNNGDNGEQQNNNQKSAEPVNTPMPPSNQPVASPVPKQQVVTLTAEKIQKLKKKVAAKQTDTEKLKILNAALKKYKYNTHQVADMMDWLLFESSKVDFAKASYSNVVDKDNYYNTLSVKFSYKDSQEELSKFLSK